MKYNVILTSLLEELEKNPGISVEEIIRKKAVELNISEKDIKELDDINKYIDDFDRTVVEMNEAREEGITRDEFVQGRVEKALDEMPESKRVIFIDSLSKTSDEMIENLESEIEETNL